MSTDRTRKKKHSFLYTERFKILEYGLIGLLVLAFGVGAIVYERKSRTAEKEPPAASPSPVPTADASIRGMNVLAALEDADVSVEPDGDGYLLTAPNEITLTMFMESDGNGIRSLTIETLLCPDPAGDSEVEQALRQRNGNAVAALRTVFDALMPVFRKSVADSETIVKQCQTVALKGAPYAKRLGSYSVRVQSDPNALPQSVTVTLTRDRSD